MPRPIHRLFGVRGCALMGTTRLHQENLNHHLSGSHARPFLARLDGNLDRLPSAYELLKA